MFWKLPSLSASSPVESLLDKENFTLEELLDEEEIIQECKALNSRLINFLRDKTQVEKLLHYIIDEPPEEANSRLAFVDEKGQCHLVVACEIFTCEIDVILKTLVEDEEVVICLMLRKTIPLMNYVKAHQDVFKQLVLVRLVGADDHLYPNSLDVMQWLAESNLLEMIVDKLNTTVSPKLGDVYMQDLSIISF